MADPKKLLEERRQLIETAMSNGRGSRIPIITNDSTWKYFYSGYLPKDGIGNTDVNKTVFKKFYSDIYMDGMLSTHYCKMLKESTLDLMGGGVYTYDKNGVPQTAHGATTVMEADEYPELIADPYKFLLEKVFPRRYNLMKRTDDKKYSDLCRVMNDVSEATQNIISEATIAPDEYGIHVVASGGYYNPVDYILDYLRDFDVIMRDIKKQPDKVRDAGLALGELSLEYIGNSKQSVGNTFNVPMHLPPFINRKDFEKVYWPSWKIVAQKVFDKGFKSSCAFERSFAHLYDILGDLPGGIVAIVDQDTPWDFKKALPNIPVMGGMPNQLLYYGNKQKCIDYAKMIIDNMAPYGGYLFSTNLSMMVPADGKAENIQVVNEFVKEYGVY